MKPFRESKTVLLHYVRMMAQEDENNERLRGITEDKLDYLTTTASEDKELDALRLLESEAYMKWIELREQITAACKLRLEEK